MLDKKKGWSVLLQAWTRGLEEELEELERDIENETNQQEDEAENDEDLNTMFATQDPRSTVVAHTHSIDTAFTACPSRQCPAWQIAC